MATNIHAVRIAVKPAAVLCVLLAVACRGKDGPTAPPRATTVPTVTITAAVPTATPLPAPDIEGPWSASFTSPDPGCSGSYVYRFVFHQNGNGFDGSSFLLTDSTVTTDTLVGRVDGRTVRGTSTHSFFFYPDGQEAWTGDFTGVLSSPNEMVLFIPLMVQTRGDASRLSCEHSITIRLTR